MGDAYPELRKLKVHVARVLEKEEQRFAETLEQGMRILEENIAQMEGKTISGEVVFKLYDTYGFPVDLTADVARERGLAIDEAGFERQMEIQKTRARASSQFGVGGEQFNLDELESTQFNGYDESCAQTRVVSIMQDGESLRGARNQQEASSNSGAISVLRGIGRTGG